MAGRVHTYISTHRQGVIASFVVFAIFIVVAIAVFLSRPVTAPGISLISRFGTEAELATAGASGLKPALEDLARRINETREAVKAQGTRIKAIEDRPPFDFKKYEDELRQNILKNLPPSVSMSKYEALEKRVVELAEEKEMAKQNFPPRSVA